MKSFNPTVSIGEFTLCCNINIQSLNYHSNPTFGNSNVSMHFFTCFSDSLVGQWQCLPCKEWVNLFFKKRFPSPDQSKELYMEVFILESNIIIERFQRSFHVQFSCWPWPWHIIGKVDSTNSCSGRLRYPTLKINKELHLKNSLHTMPQRLRISFKACLLF